MTTPEMSARDFLKGAPAYGAGSGWKIYLAVPVALAIYVVAEVLAGMLFGVFGGRPQDLLPPPAAPGTASSPFTPGLLLILAIAQFGIVLATLAVARAWGPGLTRTLRLGPPEGGLRAYLWSIALLIVATGLLNAFIWQVFPTNFSTDFKVFHGLVHGERPLLALLAICIGAPLSEEILFRGFLQSSASASNWRDLAKLLIGAILAAGLVWAMWRVGQVAPQWGPAALAAAVAVAATLMAVWVLRRSRAQPMLEAAAGAEADRSGRIPFWPAAVVVTFAWTMLHVQYTVSGMIEVFVIGLLLSWMLWRTGSLRVPLLCHALYNSTLFAVLWLVPL